MKFIYIWNLLIALFLIKIQRTYLTEITTHKQSPLFQALRKVAITFLKFIENTIWKVKEIWGVQVNTTTSKASSVIFGVNKHKQIMSQLWINVNKKRKKQKH